MLLNGAACWRESTAIAIATGLKEGSLVDDNDVKILVATSEVINREVELRERGETIDLEGCAGSARLNVPVLEAGRIRKVMSCDAPSKSSVPGVRWFLVGGGALSMGTRWDPYATRAPVRTLSKRCKLFQKRRWSRRCSLRRQCSFAQVGTS